MTNLIDLDKDGNVTEVFTDYSNLKLGETVTFDKPYINVERMIAENRRIYESAQMNATARQSFQFYGDGGLGSIWQRCKP